MTVGLAGFGANRVATGRTVLNGLSPYDSHIYMNFAKQLSSLDTSNSFNPNLITADGYPKNGSLSTNIGSALQFPKTDTTWVVKWRQGTGSIVVNTGVNVSAVGGTVNGITYAAGGQTTGVKTFVGITNATRGRAVFTFTNHGGASSGTTITAAANNGSGLIRLTLGDATSFPDGTRVSVYNGSTFLSDYLTTGRVGTVGGTVDLTGSVFSSTFTGTLTSFGSAAVYFPSGVTYTDMADFVICRLSDEAALDAGEIFTSEFKAMAAALNFKVFRPMGIALTGGTDSTMVCHYAYRPTLDKLSWSNGHYHPNLWAGTMTQSGDAYSCGTFTDYTLLGGAYVEGMTWQCTGVGLTTNTTTTPTINLNGLGAKTIVNVEGSALSVGEFPPAGFNGNVTFIYDPILDKVIYNGGGMAYGAPIELKVALCNAIYKDYWHNFPTHYTLSACASDTAYIKAHLRDGLNAVFEYVNEPWNDQWHQTALFHKRGIAMGFGVPSNEDIHSYYGMRCRQIFGQITPLFGGRQFKRVLGVQMYGSIGNVDTYMFKGQSLAPNGTGLGGLGKGNSVYNTYTGSADYTQSGTSQRPIDWVDIITYAPYYAPAQIGQSDADYTANIGQTNVADLLTNADLYATGNQTGMATALAWYDNQARRGLYPVKTVSSVSGGDTFNVTAHGLANNTQVNFPTGTFSGLTTTNKFYYVANAATNSFKITAVAGNATPLTGIGTGTGTVGKGPAITLLDMDVGQAAGGVFVAGLYSRWENYANTYSKSIVCYEGGLSGTAPSTTVCTGWGISTTYGDVVQGSSILTTGKIGNLINAYRASSYASILVYDQSRQMMGLDATSPNFGLLPHSVQPSWLSISDGSQWSLYTTTLIDGMPWQTFYGMQTFNNS